ncbi:MAG: stage II sporulation protein P [Muribaculum sp.]|nr:stage II sporulation protein P [Muribaculum sp.]
MRRGVARAAGLALFFLIGGLLWSGMRGRHSESGTALWKAVGQVFAEELADALYERFLPGVSTQAGLSCTEWAAYTQIETILPLYGMAGRGAGQKTDEDCTVREDDGHSRMMTYEELTERGNGEVSAQESESDERQETDLQELLREENQMALLYREKFVPHERKLQLDLEEYSDYETLLKTFYTVDGNTMVGRNQLDLSALLSEDLTLAKTEEGPQILIYHTHSQEAFADSVPGDADTSIVGVGEYLAQILRDDYGYTVLHHTGQYDVDRRDDAYGKALPALEELLERYPTIQVVIDLHRDEMAEGTRLAMNLDGRPTARFMFFNGLSRTKKSGDIDYLQNDYQQENLAFSFQMQLKCEEYYPGIARKIYLKGYRYNLHLRPRSLLVELGAQNNTVEEAMNACGPLAHVLDLVLAGT